MLVDYVGCSMLSVMIQDAHNVKCCSTILVDNVGCSMLSMMLYDDHNVD